MANMDSINLVLEEISKDDELNEQKILKFIDRLDLLETKISVKLILKGKF